MNLHLLHFAFIATWLGILAAEGVIEILPLRRPELRPASAAFHFYIDLFFELPVLVGVVATGTALLKPPLDAQMTWKLAGAGLAIAMNSICIAAVAARHWGDPDAAARWTRWVYRTGLAGLLPGAIALYLGLKRVG